MNAVHEHNVSAAARAAPYEKGTETLRLLPDAEQTKRAARAAPYEKGTETCDATPLVR